MHAGSHANPRPDARSVALSRVAADVLVAGARRGRRADRAELALVARASRRMVFGRRAR